jgi:hypothetical protein
VNFEPFVLVFKVVSASLDCFSLFRFVFIEAFSFLDFLTDQTLRLLLFLERLVVAATAAIGRSSFAIAILHLRDLSADLNVSSFIAEACFALIDIAISSPLRYIPLDREDHSCRDLDLPWAS